MRVAIRANSDLASGIVFIACGAVLLVFGRHYSTGTMMRVGPGFFPSIVGWGLVLVGLVELGRGIARSGQRLGAWDYRPLLIISSAFFVFAILIERLGLVLTGILVMALAALADPGAPKVKQAAIILLAPVVAAFVFIYLLNVPLRVWP